MIKTLLTCFAFCIFFTGCAEKQKRVPIYERKAADDSERRSGPAMLLYEQAELDQDINENIIVIPPGENDKKDPTPAN
jgi:hypothetical protein